MPTSGAPPPVWRREIALRVSREPLLAAAAMLGLALVLFSDAAFGGRMLFLRDIGAYWNGAMAAFVASVADGSWPLWNPYPAFGQPLLAMGITQLLYPTTWLNLVLSPATAYTLLVVGHVAWAGFGACVFSRRLGVSWSGAVAAGLLFAASGPFLSVVHMANMLVAVAWLPWIFATGERALASRRLPDALAWGACVAATVLAGSPETGLMGAASALLGLHRVDWRQPFRATNRALLRTALVAAAFAVGLSAAQWLPTLEAKRQSLRASVDREQAVFWSNHPVAMAQTLLPILLDELPLNRGLRAEMYENREPFLYSIYLGLGALALVAAGLVASSSRHRRLLAGIGIAAALLSLGRWSPVYQWAALVVPIEEFRFPAKFLVLVALAWAALAGLGSDAWRAAGSGTAGRWRVGVLAPTLLLSLVAAWASSPDSALWAALLVTPADFGRPWEASLAFRQACRALAGSALLAAVLAAAAALKSRRPGVATPVLALAVAALAVVELAANLRSLNPTVPRSLQAYRPAALDGLSRRPNRTLVLSYRFAPPFPELPFDAKPELVFLLPRVYPALVGQGQWGIESAGLDAPKLNLRHSTLLLNTVQDNWRLPVFPKLARIAGFERVIALHDVEPAGTLELVARLPPPQDQPIRVYRVRDALPRAYTVGRARAVDSDAEAFRSFADADFDPARDVLLHDGAEARPAAPEFSGRARPIELGFDRVVIEAELAEPGYLVLLESYAPEWEARVDGRPAPILRANVAFRAVELGVGRHIVEMRYRPKSVLLGLGLTAMTVVVAGLGLVRAGRSAAA